MGCCGHESLGACATAPTVAPQAAPESFAGGWCYSLDEEWYRGSFATEAEAHGAALDELEAEAAVGEPRFYWIARSCHPLDLIDKQGWHVRAGEAVVEQVDEWCADEVAADDFIVRLSGRDAEALGRLVFQFIRQRAKVCFFGIKDPARHEHVVGAPDAE